MKKVTRTFKGACINLDTGEKIFCPNLGIAAAKPMAAKMNGGKECEVTVEEKTYWMTEETFLEYALPVEPKKEDKE